MPGYHLAQVNIARMLAPLDDALMAGFVARLAEVNALADRSAGGCNDGPVEAPLAGVAGAASCR